MPRKQGLRLAQMDGTDPGGMLQRQQSCKGISSPGPVCRIVHVESIADQGSAGGALDGELFRQRGRAVCAGAAGVAAREGAVEFVLRELRDAPVLPLD